jgi:hypothetical protein
LIAGAPGSVGRIGTQMSRSIEVVTSMTSERAISLAHRFERAIGEFACIAESLTDDEWTRYCPNERCTVAALVHHVAVAIAFQLQAFAPIVRGEATKPITWAFLAKVNAEDAERNAATDHTQTLELLRENAAATATVIRAFSDDDLKQSGYYVEDTPALTIDQWIRHAMIGHITSHLASLKGVIAEAR